MAVLYFGERQQEEASNAMTRFKYAYVLNVMSDDHPGIVHRFKENRVRPYLMLFDVRFGGLFGSTAIIEVRNAGASDAFVHFGGRIPAPIQSLGN